MAIIKKSFIAQVTIILFVALFIPLITNGQITSHYGAKTGDSGSNLVGFDLTIYNPISKEVYSNKLPLNFKIDWIVGVYPFFNWTFAGIYTYSIDSKSPVSIESNQSESDRIYPVNEGNFKYNPSFSYLLDISNLANGQHSIVLSAGFYYESQSGVLEWQFLNETSSPIYFQVQNSMPASNPTPTPTPTVPEFPATLAITLLLVMALVFAVVFGRKT